MWKDKLASFPIWICAMFPLQVQIRLSTSLRQCSTMFESYLSSSCGNSGAAQIQHTCDEILLHNATERENWALAAFLRQLWIVFKTRRQQFCLAAHFPSGPDFFVTQQHCLQRAWNGTHTSLICTHHEKAGHYWRGRNYFGLRKREGGKKKSSFVNKCSDFHNVEERLEVITRQCKNDALHLLMWYNHAGPGSNVGQLITDIQ